MILLFILIVVASITGFGAFLIVKAHGAATRFDRNRAIERELIDGVRDAAAQQKAAEKLLPKLKRDGRL